MNKKIRIVDLLSIGVMGFMLLMPIEMDGGEEEENDALTQAIGFFLSEERDAVIESPFSESEEKYLSLVHFIPSILMSHPTHMDRIIDVEKGLVRRVHLDYLGNKTRERVIEVEPEKLQEKLDVLAEYYSFFGEFPETTAVDIKMLQIRLANEKRRQEK